jgi:hypothetical protein
MPALTRAIHPFNQAFLFSMDKNIEQCKKRMRQQIAHIMAM